MRSWRMIVGVLGSFLLLSGMASAKTPATVKCKDGTTATAGKEKDGKVATAGRGAGCQNGGAARVPPCQKAPGENAKCPEGPYLPPKAHSGARSARQGLAEG